MSKSYAPEVKVNGEWHRNTIRFGTNREAEDYARDLYSRWTLTTDYRSTEASEDPNYILDGNHQLISIKETKEIIM